MPDLPPPGVLSSARRRREAALAIGAQGGADDAAKLFDALSDRAAVVRRACITAVVELTQRFPRLRPTTTRTLTRRLSEEADPSVRVELGRAVEALRRVVHVQGKPTPPRPPPARRKPAQRSKAGPFIRASSKSKAIREDRHPGWDDDFWYEDHHEGDEPPSIAPRLDPLSPLETALAALEPKPLDEAPRFTLEARLSADNRAALKAAFSSLLRASSAHADKLAACQAPWALAPLPEPPCPVTTLHDLAAIAVLRAAGQSLPVTLDLPRLAAHALRCLRSPNELPGGLSGWFAEGFSAFVEAAQSSHPSLLVKLFEARSTFHQSTLPALRLLARPARDASRGALAKLPPFASHRHGEHPEHEQATPPRGSSLPLLNLVATPASIVDAIGEVAAVLELPAHRHLAASWAWSPYTLASLLASGAGSLTTLDYPHIKVAVRAHVGIVPGEAMQQLLEAHEQIAALDRLIDGGDVDALLRRHLTSGALPLCDVLSADSFTDLVTRVRRGAAAHIALRATPDFPDGVRVTRRRVRHLLETTRALPPLAATTPAGRDRLRQGLVWSLLDLLHEGLGGAHRHSLKEALIALSRRISFTHAETSARLSDADLADPRKLVDHLINRHAHAPLELCQSLGLGAASLPRLAGGRLTEEEHALNALLRSLHAAPAQGEATRTITLKPLCKAEALVRGDLGSDCSSRYLPFRALSRHHVYYGLFEGGVQLAGYITVFEAFAERDGGEAAPALVLETINVPGGDLDGVHEDLLLLFSAVAAHRGLERLVAVTSLGTYNFQNQTLVQKSARFRRGERVALTPADPAVWYAYSALCPYESRSYVSYHLRGGFEGIRALAPFDPSRDRVLEENEREADRIAALPRRPLLVTARAEGRTAGFISQDPA